MSGLPGAAHQLTPVELNRMQEARFPVEAPRFGALPVWAMRFTLLRVRVDTCRADGERWLSYLQDRGNVRVHAFTRHNLAHELDLEDFRARLGARLTEIQALECPGERPGLWLSPVRQHWPAVPDSRMFALQGRRPDQNGLMVSLRLLHAAKQALADLAVERHGASR